MFPKPNILLIVADQQRYDCIGESGVCPVKTPNINRLGKEGIWFSNAFTAIPLCCPARQAILNGQRPEVFGALWNFNIALKTYALQPSEYSWTNELKRIGYQMSYIGEWHVNPEHNPLEYGFDYYFGEEDYDEYRKSKYPNVQYCNGWLGEYDPIPVEDSRTHYLAGLACEKIKEYSLNGMPWHIRLDFPEPHLPCRPAGEFFEMYKPSDVIKWGSFEDNFINKPYVQKQQLLSWGIDNYTWNEWAPIIARYYGIISQIDDAIGMVLKLLEDTGISDNTIIIYTSDHGDMCGSHRMMDKHYIMYDDVVRVPLIIKWPGVVKKDSLCDKFVCNTLDLAPTILEILGIKPKAFFQGRSLLDILKGNDVNNWRSEVVSTYNGQQFGLYTQRMIRNHIWKYVWNLTDIDELYNLEEDPYELNNRIYDPSCLKILSDMREKLYLELNKDGDGMVKNSWTKNQLLNNKKY